MQAQRGGWFCRRAAPRQNAPPLGGQQAAVGCAAWGVYTSSPSATVTGFAPSAPVSTVDATLIR